VPPTMTITLPLSLLCQSCTIGLLLFFTNRYIL